MMLMPGLNSNVVPARFRLLLAVSTAFVLMPTLAGRLPPMPPDLLSVALMVAGEATVGSFFGILAQILITPLDIAGSSISFAVGLTNMFTVDPVTEEQSQLLTGFLNLLAITLVFLTDSHHLMFRALVDSYGLFAPGGSRCPSATFRRTLMRTMADGRHHGVQAGGTVDRLHPDLQYGLGLLNRLVPQMQVFFVGMPLQILGGLSILMFCLPVIMVLVHPPFHRRHRRLLRPG